MYTQVNNNAPCLLLLLLLLLSCSLTRDAGNAVAVKAGFGSGACCGLDCSGSGRKLLTFP
jgi:hypothetical protein